MIVPKVWGEEEILANEKEYCCKVLKLKGGFQSSFHYHKVKKETFIVRSGIVRLEQRDVRGAGIDEMLTPGDSVTIYPGTPHRFSSDRDSEILEVSTHHDDADVVRQIPSGPL